MHFTLPRRVLLAALHAAVKVATTTTPPIVSHLLVTATPGALGGTVTISAMDLAALQWTATLRADVRRQGAACIAAKLFAETVDSLPEGDLSLDVAANGTATLKAGRGKRTLGTADAAEYPSLVHAEGVSLALPVAVLRTLYQRAGHAMSDDIARSHLCAFYLRVESGALLGVATDGHRMAVAHVPVENMVPFAEGVARIAQKGILVPRIALANIVANLPKAGLITLTIDDLTRTGEAGPRALVSFAWEGEHYHARYTTKLVVEAFPSWEQVVPTAWDHAITANRDELLKAVRGVCVATQADRASGIVLEPRGGSIVIRASDPERGDAENELDTTISGNPPRIGVKGDYLALALAAYDCETITLGLSGELDPIVVFDPAEPWSRQVIMPMRL